MLSDTGKFTKALFTLISILVLVVIVSNFYTFYFQKNYDFVVETSCEAGELCFIRDCGDGECPPNELEQYKLFMLNAADFGSCSVNSCEFACESGRIRCEEILCDESAGDTCVLIPPTE